MKWWYENEEDMPRKITLVDYDKEGKPFHRDVVVPKTAEEARRLEMEFDKSRVYTAVNADELRAGDKVIVADTLYLLKQNVESGITDTLKEVRDDSYGGRFLTENNLGWELAYLVERAENCTNCAEGRWDAEHQKILCDPVNCGNGNVVFRNHEIEVCEYWKPIAKMPKTEKKEMCLNCKHYNKLNDFRDCRLVNNPTGSCPHYEAEKHYRPFKDTDELVKVWDEKCQRYGVYGWQDEIEMPHIWVRYKKEDGSKSKGHLIHGFYEDIIEMQDRTMNMEDLFYFCEFCDGSPCGVEE